MVTMQQGRSSSHPLEDSQLRRSPTGRTNIPNQKVDPRNSASKQMKPQVLLCERPAGERDRDATVALRSLRSAWK